MLRFSPRLGSIFKSTAVILYICNGCHHIINLWLMSWYHRFVMRFGLFKSKLAVLCNAVKVFLKRVIKPGDLSGCIDILIRNVFYFQKCFENTKLTLIRNVYVIQREMKFNIAKRKLRTQKPMKNDIFINSTRPSRGIQRHESNYLKHI